MVRAKHLLLLAPLVVLLAAAPTWAAGRELSADQLVLVVNRNVPEGRELAEFYRQARGVPEGRIVELDLPLADRMPRRQYEQQVVPEVRRFLLEQGLRDQARCLVTFYGVPLAIDGRQLSDEERLESRQVAREATELAKRMAPLVREAERMAGSIGHRPQGRGAQDAESLEVLLARLSAAEAFMNQRGGALPVEQRQALLEQAGALRQRFDTPMASDGLQLDRAEVQQLLARSDAAARQILRQRMRARASLRDYAQILASHQRLLSEEQSDAAFDSDLAMLWVDNVPAAGWLPNPLARGPDPGAAGQRPTLLMVSRLDGRDPQQVRDLITTSVSIERQGLRGKIVIDSRGLAAEGGNGQSDGYGVFDEQLRRLAGFLEQKATLPVVHDDHPEVIQPPGPADVALYVGWYSVGRYVPGMSFARGAVGYHVASFEMRSLRAPGRTGWVRGLLDDGVVATTGPVSEPYLIGFPPPEEFVPLLLTGELTLAEVYWRTVPLVSWKLGLIGDPLYRPFAQRPALAADNLPPQLRLKLNP